MTVIEEVARFKKDLNEVGRNARTVSRLPDGLRDLGSLKNGVALASGGMTRVHNTPVDVHGQISGGTDTNDHRILATVVVLRDSLGGRIRLVTRDTNIRLKWDTLGIPAEDYRNARVAAKGTKLQKVGQHREGTWGIFARNKEPLFAMDLLLDPSIQGVTLSGMAGSGKTLLAIACGLRMIGDESVYLRMLVSLPIFPLDRDIGYLPDEIEQKLNPWMKPIFDDLELLLSTRDQRSSEAMYSYLLDQGIIQVEPLTYIRGRSIPNQFKIVDEAQNRTPHEVKTVLTREGEGTPYVDAPSNGLTYTIERFKRASIAGHVTYTKGERAPLVELAATLL